MNEFFLHFVWQYQFFDKQNLRTLNDEELIILHPGYRNTNQGPDFSHARIRMDGMDWHGNVEIHIKSSDWNLHKHQTDKNYDTVLLHIVWENDCDIKREDGSILPVLLLKDKVDCTLIDRYRTFINSGLHLPCQYYIKEVPSVQITSMFDKVLSERLERKGKEILKLLEQNKNDWEETFWQLLVRNFGFKINNDAFEQLSRAIPFKILLKHANNPLQIEALLFGQSGLLDCAPEDVYVKKMKEEFAFLSHKYSLHDKKMLGHQWKFLRTRPYNFPTIRIAQLASLIKGSERLVNLINEKLEILDYANLLKMPVSSYWQEHYKFGEKMAGGVPGITDASVYNIITNVVIPLNVAQYLARLNEDFPERQFHLMERMPAEINKISKDWTKIGVKIRNTYDSQAGLELYNQYCIKKKCLSCKIGMHIIKQ